MQRGVEAAPRPGALAGDDGAGLAVADEHHPADARQLLALDDLAIGEGDERAGRDVEPGLDDAVVAEADPDAGVGTEEAALADRDLFGATARQRAHDRRAAAEIGVGADDDALADAALDHRRAERAGVEVAEAFVHHDRAVGEVGAEADPRGVGDAHTGRRHVVGHRRELVDAAHDECPTLVAQREADLVEVGRGDGTAVGPRHRVQLAEDAVEVQRARGGEAVRQQVQAEVGVGCRRRRRVDVDGHPDRADRDAPRVVGAVAAGEGDVDLLRRLLAELAPTEPAVPGVEDRAVASDRAEPGAPRHPCHRDLRPQRREQDHVADRLDPRQHHHEAVDADAQPAGRRHAVLEGAQVVLVDRAALGVAGVACTLLLLEALPLLDGVVELAVAVGELAGVGEQLEALGQERIGAVDPRQWRDLDRVPRDEHRGDDVGLDGRFEQLLDQLPRAPLRLPPDAEPLAERAHVLDRLRRVHLLADRLADEVDHPPLRQPGAEVDGLAADLDDRRAERIARRLHDELLGERHHVGDVGVRLVGLHHRELGVVPAGETLVAEHPADLEHAVHAADDQPLEVQLEGDPQVQRHVQDVVVGDERAGVGTARVDVQHRRLDLDVAASVERAPEAGDDLVAHLEGAPGVGVDGEVDVTLAEPGVRIGEAVPLVGQRAERLGEQVDTVGLDRQLAGTASSSPCRARRPSRRGRAP